MTILFWLYKSRNAKTGEVPVMMRISIDGKRTNFSTGLAVDPKSWDQDRQRIRGTSPAIKEMNTTLSNLTTAAREACNEFLKKNQPADPEAIRNAIQVKDKATHTLMGAFAYQLANLRARVGHDVSPATVKKYETAERKVQAFLQAIHSRKDISLYELDHRFIVELDLHMRTKGGLGRNAVVKNMQQLKRVIKVCISLDWLTKDPFQKYSCKLNETDRGYLTEAELQTIEGVDLPSKRLEQSRDVFVFSCYTGLAYADLAKLTMSNFERGVNGLDWIVINRTKTKTKALIPLLPKARQILDKYKESPSNSPGKPLPVISNQNLNKYLKEIAQICGISKRISMHLGRHTFATTVTLEKGIDIATVSRMLGHKRLQTTQIYAKVTQLKIAGEISKIM